MMPNTFGPVRVSILERIVPSLAFIVAAVSGAVGGAMLIRFFSLLSQAELAGYAAFFGGVAEIELAVGGVLILAVALCAVGIVVSIIRLFTTNKTASPPGLLFLMLGLLSLVPPFAIHYVLHTMKEVVTSPDPAAGFGTLTTAAYFAIGGPVVITLVLLAFPFVPFTSRAGRKSSPIVCLMFVAIVTATLAGIYFWEARKSIAARDKDRVEQYSQPRESPSMNSDSVPLPNQIDDMLDDVNGASLSNGSPSSSRTKTISGGVLNERAIELPQPEYPPAARAVRATGQVSVQVLVDGNGNVISATAVSGHPLLRGAAVQAARKAKFKPTMMSGQPTNVAGVLTYKFSEQ
jgi:TonB family protein